MQFTIETSYDAKALSVMARAIRKTTRKRKSRRTHLFGWIVIVLGLLLTILPGNGPTVSSVITWLAILLILSVFIFEDRLNGYIAKKRMLPGMDSSTVTFAPEGYSSVTNVGSSQFGYDKIKVLAETSDYFVFIFSENHAQIYDKHNLTGGTVDEFRKFIEKMTHNKTQFVK